MLNVVLLRKQFFDVHLERRALFFTREKKLKLLYPDAVVLLFPLVKCDFQEKGY